jgi:hypothetical protein
MPVSRYLLACALTVSACGSPEPTPPRQGIYGALYHLGVESSRAIAGGQVFVGSPDIWAGDAVPPGAESALSDQAGNFRIELPSGDFRVCLASAGIAIDCDCQLAIAAGAAIRRDWATDDAGVAGWGLGEPPLSSCALDEPSPPAEGVWGYVPAGAEVCVASLVGITPEACTRSDHHGRYSIEMAGGDYRICFVDAAGTRTCVFKEADQPGAVNVNF